MESELVENCNTIRTNGKMWSYFSYAGCRSGADSPRIRWRRRLEGQTTGTQKLIHSLIFVLKLELYISNFTCFCIDIYYTFFFWVAPSGILTTVWYTRYMMYWCVDLHHRPRFYNMKPPYPPHQSNLISCSPVSNRGYLQCVVHIMRSS